MTTYHSPSHLLLSRAAESAYWAGRYLERAEGTARLIKTHTSLTIDLPRSANVGWGPLMAVVGIDPLFAARNPNATEALVVGHLASDPENSSSVRSSIAAVHHNLRTTRSFMPVEAAEVLIELQLYVQENADRAVDRWTRVPFLNTVIRGCQTLSGILAEGMNHDEAYSFFTIGRRLERADLVARVLDVQSSLVAGRDDAAAFRELVWTSGLRSVSAVQSFRRRGVPTSAAEVIAFLLYDPMCPRTIESCISLVEQLLSDIPQHEAVMDVCREIPRLTRAADVSVLAEGGDMHDFADQIQLAISNLHVAIDETWFQPEVAASQSQSQSQSLSPTQPL